MNFLVLFLVGCLLSLNVHAKTHSETIRGTIEVVSGYQALGLVEESASEMTLKIVERDITTKTTSSTSAGTETRVDQNNQVPDETAGEYARLKIQKISDTKVLLVHTAKEKVTVENTDYSFWAELRTEAKADLKDGTWADLVAGNNVQIVVPKSEQRRLDKEMVKYFENMLKQEMLGALEHQFPGYPVTVRAKVNSYKMTDGPLTGTKLKMVSSPSGSMGITLSLSIKL